MRLIAELAASPQWRAPLAVSLGAVPGALARYYLSLLCGQWFGIGFPMGTLLANLSGAFLMGFFVTFTLDRLVIAPDLRLLIAVGFLGSYTTFSTYALDASNLLRSGQSGLALLYGLGSAGLGLLCLESGRLVARWL
ncbi:MAG: fluoride efflux transporter CrcB [Pegethrix bostrychoides GSE-TBD4-15B]|uniref:Fluoride-specific ion channel FluC n=1 Tax=Pegethrix bostrychoides GSE-TBD4-15B TaxID=2839662 RepID=A0A951U3J3_9CYAN|nr:fluoride efflux transporter CrcB [Pegethrix bostrychoides GSE-TBD4-15B]